MKRKIEEVRLITVGPEDIVIYHGPRFSDFKRDKWTLVAEDVIRIEARRNAIGITPKVGIGVSCQILEDKKIILCGERPEKMFID